MPQLMNSLISNVPFVLVGAVGLGMLGRFAPDRRKWAVAGSLLALLYGILNFVMWTFLVNLLWDLGSGDVLIRVVDYGLLFILVAAFALLGVAAARRAPSPTVGAFAAGYAPAPQAAPPYGSPPVYGQPPNASPGQQSPSQQPAGPPHWNGA